MFSGNDNYGRPKSEYIDKLKNMDNIQLYSECYDMIYQSARCNNNPRADWHWMVDACYSECSNRANVSIYTKAWDDCVKNNT